MANLVSVERADLSFGTVHVLDSVSLDVGEGDSIGVVAATAAASPRSCGSSPAARASTTAGSRAGPD